MAHIERGLQRRMYSWVQRTFLNHLVNFKQRQQRGLDTMLWQVVHQKSCESFNATSAIQVKAWGKVAKHSVAVKMWASY